jgi:hypothetical protein
MKTLQFSLILFILWMNVSFCQSGWYPANISDSTSGFVMYDIQFVNSNSGYAIGVNTNLVQTLLLKTTNGGNNWQKIILTEMTGTDISFPDVNTGYIINTSNNMTRIHKTTNAGINWFCTDTLTGTSTGHLDFCDVNTGYARAGMYPIY